MAHSLGFFHEHSRPDRDKFVEVKWGNVQPGTRKFKNSRLYQLKLIIMITK